MNISEKKLTELTIIFIFILSLLNLADAFSTYLVIESGFGKELNPIMLRLMDDGMNNFLYFKIFISAILIAVGIKVYKSLYDTKIVFSKFYKYRKKISYGVFISTFTVVLLYLLIIINNMYIFWGIK